jgi:hypothetical protein
VTINTVFKLTEQLASAQNYSKLAKCQFYPSSRVVSCKHCILLESIKNLCLSLNNELRALSMERQQNRFLIRNTVKVRNRGEQREKLTTVPKVFTKQR